MKGTLILIGFVVSTLLTMAQASVKATITPIEMMIGEQAQVLLTIEGATDDAKIEWPKLEPRKMLVPGVEVISTRHPDPNSLLVTLTSFDGNLYPLPPFKVKVNGKEMQTNELALKVVGSVWNRSVSAYEKFISTIIEIELEIWIFKFKND